MSDICNACGHPLLAEHTCVTTNPQPAPISSGPTPRAGQKEEATVSDGHIYVCGGWPRSAGLDTKVAQSSSMQPPAGLTAESSLHPADEKEIRDWESEPAENEVPPEENPLAAKYVALAAKRGGYIRKLLAELTRLRQRLSIAETTNECHVKVLMGAEELLRDFGPGDVEMRIERALQRVSEVEAERGAELAQVCERQAKRIRSLERQLAAAMLEAVRGLVGYATHKSGCAVRNPHPLDRLGYPCDCGYEELSAALKGSKADEAK